MTTEITRLEKELEDNDDEWYGEILKMRIKQLKDDNRGSGSDSVTAERNIQGFGGQSGL